MFTNNAETKTAMKRYNRLQLAGLFFVGITLLPFFLAHAYWRQKSGRKG